MSKVEPTIQKYMTYQPESIDVTSSLAEADKVMRDKKIRHLPVIKDNNLFGIISDRDLKTSLSLLGSNPETVQVKDICQENPYTVSPDDKLHEVLDVMTSNHYGSALVEQNGKLVGIFTTIDACRAFSEILQQRFHE